jgi:exopolyphosphatase/guanosine-5'-triphosphate,3'-diphosphate pyrophosphatase
MNNRFAVMDLGTNTFHLLIAEVGSKGFNEISRDHEAVKLGEGGMSKGFIQQSAFDRGVKTIERFAEKINRYNVTKVKAIATSALRNARNGPDFVAMVQQNASIEIQIIDGIKEAEYIYEGVKFSGALSDSSSLIMDIGGGSVEFIICNNTEMLWKCSFEIGAARLIEQFHQIDPITPQSIHMLHRYLDDKLQPLFDAYEQFSVDKLIGSAGAFETFAEVIELEQQLVFDIKQLKTYDFKLLDFIRLTDRLIISSNAERSAVNGIIPLRVDMIVVASIITRYVLSKLGIQKIGMSTYSLKEGVMASLSWDLYRQAL